MKRAVRMNVVLIAFLLLTGGMINAQGIGRGMAPGQYCGNIPGLTDKQKTELTELATKHRAEMDALRAERQGAKDRDAWYAAGQKMTAATDKHRFDIRNVLTDEQKEAYAPRNIGGKGPSVAGRGRGAGYRAPAGMGGRGQVTMAPGRMGGCRGWR
jgi:hypothetical protein